MRSALKVNVSARAAQARMAQNKTEKIAFTC